MIAPMVDEAAAPTVTPSRRGEASASLVERLHLPTMLLALVVIASWELLSRQLSPFVLPSPVTVAQRLAQVMTTADVWINVWATIWRISLGFGIALVVAVAVAFLASRWRATRQLIGDVTTVLNSVSVFVWMVLAVVWFGLSNAGPVFTTAMIVLPIQLANVMEGVLSVDRKLLQMGRVYRFTPGQAFVHITAPATIPYLVAGMKVGYGIALKVSVVAELFGVASGVGYQMNLARERLATADVFVWAIVLVLVMILVDKGLFGMLSRRVEGWR